VQKVSPDRSPCLAGREGGFRIRKHCERAEASRVASSGATRYGCPAGNQRYKTELHYRSLVKLRRSSAARRPTRDDLPPFSQCLRNPKTALAASEAWENGREDLSAHVRCADLGRKQVNPSNVNGRATSSRLLRSAATPQHHWMIPAPIHEGYPSR